MINFTSVAAQTIHTINLPFTETLISLTWTNPSEYPPTPKYCKSRDLKHSFRAIIDLH